MQLLEADGFEAEEGPRGRHRVSWAADSGTGNLMVGMKGTLRSGK